MKTFFTNAFAVVHYHISNNFTTPPSLYSISPPTDTTLDHSRPAMHISCHTDKNKHGISGVPPQE